MIIKQLKQEQLGLKIGKNYSQHIDFNLRELTESMSSSEYGHILLSQLYFQVGLFCLYPLHPTLVMYKNSRQHKSI